MEKEKTVPEILTDIMNGICSDYCKYAETVRSQIKDIGVAERVLVNTYCKDCPLVKLI